MEDIKINGYVNKATDDTIIVRIFDENVIPSLQALGFEFYVIDKNFFPNASSDIYYISRGMPPSSEYYALHMYIEVTEIEKKALLFSKLNKLNIAFVGGKEWNPIEVYEEI